MLKYCKFLFTLAMTFFIGFALSATTPTPLKKRILVGSPIRQKPVILNEFLKSLDAQNKINYTLDFYFIDDNEQDESKELLKQFAVGKNCIIEEIKVKPSDDAYICNEHNHCWKNSLIWKVAKFKDQMINKAANENYDYLFLIDSDIVLHPKTIDQLIKANKEIISNIFWTSWSPNTIAMPQVWISDEYIQYRKEEGEIVPPEEAKKRMYAFYDELKVPGIYEVGGLGACTLISHQSLKKGVNFQRISNLSFWGEDRHFCVRAVALGIPLFVDTHYPAYHIYRESAMEGVEQFKKECMIDNQHCNEKITLSLIMKNEENNCLREMLTATRQYITDAVIIDDGSSDNSVKIAEEILKDIPLKLIKNSESKFSNEINLRKQQWDEVVKTNPDWILTLDADEIFEDRFKDEIQKLISAKDVDAYYFRLYDFWDDTHYRDDPFWSAHKQYRPFLIRYNPDVEYPWKETPQHCGRYPLTINDFHYKISDLRLKHYGWVKPELRQAKYDRYQKLDPDGKYGWKEQYESILDSNPNLIEWKE